MSDLAEALEKTSAEVVETGKAGTVTASFKITTKSQGDTLIIVDEIVSRRSPKKDPRGSIFYAVEGGLYREDPRKLPLEFRFVNTQAGEIRDVDSEQVERAIR